MNVFFAWQDQISNRTNRRLISQSIRSACNHVESLLHGSVILCPDEATRDESGSPNIPSTILRKIDSAAVFIADLTPVGQQVDDRHVPNPNVVFELGYAVATLGWPRIILLFNKAYGPFPEALPFDIDRHRASPYEISENDLSTKTLQAKKDHLIQLLQVALQAIVSKDPKRPADEHSASDEAIQRRRTVSSLNWLLSRIHFPSIQKHIEGLPERVWHKSLYFQAQFSGVYGSDLFYLYDKELSEVVDRFARSFEETLSYGIYYRDSRNGNTLIFKGDDDAPLSGEKAKAWEAISIARRDLAESKYELLKTLREKYIEVDLEELNAQAWAHYIEYENSVSW